jgi:hypothetical protein
LIALNLLEPPVTMLILFGGWSLVNAVNLLAAWTFIVGAIPLSALLLPPLFTRAPLAFQCYGALRWTNTVFFWLVGARALTTSSDGESWASVALRDGDLVAERTAPASAARALERDARRDCAWVKTTTDCADRARRADRRPRS